ncbi:MAG: hypothetical protein ABGX16_05895 [Pirellulales bacterium]
MKKVSGRPFTIKTHTRVTDIGKEIGPSFAHEVLANSPLSGGGYSIPTAVQGEILVVAELQTEDTTAIDWQSLESVEGPPTALRLLAKVPRLNDRLRQSLRELPEEVLLVDGQPMDQSLSAVDSNLLELQAERIVQTVSQTEPQEILGLSDLSERDAERESHPGLHQAATPTISTESGWLSRICELHETMSPYAGLIVAFALFMSAGLLYWLVLGPFTNTNHPQEPTGMGTIGQFSSGPATTASAPVGPVPRSQPVITEEEPGVTEEKAAQSVSWQHDLSGGTAVAADPRSYPKTHY